MNDMALCSNFLTYRTQIENMSMKSRFAGFEIMNN